MTQLLEITPDVENDFVRELEEAAGLGPETDWAELVQEHSGMLHAICRRFSLTRDERDDAVQHTWLKLYENRASLRQPDRVRGWLATTIRRECIALRAARWRESPVEEPPAAAVEPDLIEALTGRLLRRRLGEAVELLPRHERAVVEMLLDPEEPSYAEMAQRLNTPIGSIGPRRGRALQHLRLLMRDVLEEDLTTASLDGAPGAAQPGRPMSAAGGRS